MQLTIRKINNTTLELTLRDDAGALVAEATGPVNEKRKREWSKKCGVAELQFSQWVLGVKDQPFSKSNKPSETYDVPGPQSELLPSSEPFTIRLRGLQQPASEAKLFTANTPLQALGEVLQYAEYTYAEPVFEWQSDRLAVLDIDYHGLPFNSRPSPHHLHALAASIQPTPCWFHVSHGHGAKLYYVEQAGFAADELAGAAGLAWCWKDRRATAEVKHGSRHPRYPRHRIVAGVPVVDTIPTLPAEGSQSVDISAVSMFFSREASDEQIETYLAERGLLRGGKYAHANCPIAPTAPDSHGEPVFIGETGVFCHACEAYGRTWGRGKPGFVSYSQLVGGTSDTMRQMVKSLCHWEHAQAVLQHTFGTKLRSSVLRFAYSAVLKAVHGAGNPAAKAAMYAGRDIIRLDGRWSTIDARATIGKDAINIYRGLPATWRVQRNLDGEYDVEVSNETVDYFRVPNIDLTTRGYPAVTLIHGARIYGEKLDYTDERIIYPVPNIEFLKEAAGRRKPMYTSLAKRMPVEDAWKQVETVFPGIDRNYVYMLLIAKGFAEGRATQCPFLLVHGPAASGKSTTAHVAASIAGDYATEMVWTQDRQRFDQAIRQGSDAGSFVVLNELFKEADRCRVGARSALDPLLNITDHTTSHVLYAGASPLGKTPVIVVTDVTLPRDVAIDTQLGRRFINVNLSSRIDWSNTLHSVGKPHRFRLASNDNAAACDAILSDCIDRFFSYARTMEDCATELGYSTIEKSPEYGDRDEAIQRFYALILEAAANGSKDLPKSTPVPKGDGWVYVRIDWTTPLADAWRNIADGRQVPKIFTSRLCDEKDLAKVLKVEACDGTTGIKLDIDRREDHFFARFRSGPFNAPCWINGFPVGVGVASSVAAAGVETISQKIQNLSS